MYETLVTKEEMMNAEEHQDYFILKSDKRVKHEKYFSKGLNKSEMIEEYNSNNTKILNKEEVIKVLLDLPEVSTSQLKIIY